MPQNLRGPFHLVLPYKAVLELALQLGMGEVQLMRFFFLQGE
jgi:hypothetical protein